MNGALAGGGDINLQLNTILDLLSNKEDKNIKEKILEKFTKDKNDEQRQNRYKQKERLYQAIPIVLDGVSLDGKKGLKSLKSLFSFPTTTVGDKKTKDLPDIVKYAMLIGGLLLAAYIFLKNKWQEVVNSIDTFLKSFSLTGKINAFLAKLLDAEKIAEIKKLLRAKATEFIGKLLNTEKYDDFMKLAPETKGLFQRFKAIPQKYLQMNVDELSKVIQSESEWSRYAKEYIGAVDEGKSKFIKDLEELKRLKEVGTSTDDITKAAQEFSKANSAIESTIKTVEGPLKAVTTGVESFFKGVGGFLVEFIKLIPFGDKALKIAGFLGQYAGPLGVVLDAFETMFHIFDKEKMGQLGKEEITIALTTFVLRAIGWLGSIILFPLAFLRREDIEQNIKKIFEEEDMLGKIGRMFGFIVDVIIKSLGETIHFFLNIPLLVTKLARKISMWFGGDGETLGFIENFIKDFMDEFRKNIENFNYVDLVKPISDFFADLLTPLFQFFIDENFRSDIFNSMSKKLSEVGTKIKDSVLFIVDWFKSLFTVENLKKLINFLADASPLGIITKGAKKAFDYFTEDKKPGSENTPVYPGAKVEVEDYVDDQERTLYTKDGVYSFDKNDQILALKNGGPLQEAISSIGIKTQESVENLRAVVEQINKTLIAHLNKAEKLYDAEYKLMSSNNEILQQIKDKESPSSNVVVNNSSNNMVFSHKTSSNNEYRSELANKVFAY